MSDSRLDDDPVVYRYTRSQALAHGVLVDLSQQAASHGISFPLACTSALYERYLVPDEKLQSQGQSTQGHIHDLLTLLTIAIKSAGDTTERITLSASFLMAPGKRVTVTLTCICGPGDTGEPVLTLLLPGED